MPTSYAISRQERVYLVSESTFGQIPVVTNGSYCRTMPGTNLTALVNNYPRPDKTGTRSQVIGVLGRKSAVWNVSMSLAGNGAAGVVPDCAPILTALFGAAPVIAGGVSVTYSLSDPAPIPSFSMYSFRTPATLTQRIVEGAVVAEATFNLGQNIATWSANGTGIWCLDSDSYATSDATQKGGLGAFPTEPGAPVSNGQPTVGFTGSATYDGNLIAEIQTATLRVRTGNSVALDTFGSYYPVLAEGDERSIGLAFTIYDNDGAGIKNIKNKALTQTPIDITLVMGTVAGSIFTWSLKNVQVSPPTYDDSRNRYMCVFPESLSHATSIAVRDELGLVIT